VSDVKERKPRAGFGLVELFIAISVATLVLVSVGVAQSVCFELNRTSRDTITATSDLESAMESVLLVPPHELIDPEGPYPPGAPLPAYEGLHLADERIVVEYPNWTGADAPDPLEVRLTIRFSDHAGRTRSLSVSTLRTH